MKNFKPIITYILLGLAAVATAQSTPTISWTNVSYGWSMNGRLNAVIENQKGELVAVGTSYVAGQRRDALWVSFSKDGMGFKETTINGIDNRHDEAFGIRQTLDGGYVLVGATQRRENGKTDAWLVKTDDKGTAILSKQFGSIGDDVFFDITEDDEDNLYALGHQNGALFLVKTDRRGTAIFQKTYSGVAIQNAHLTWLADGKLVLVGAQIVDKKWETLIKCVDTEGGIIWQQTLADVLINGIKRDNSGNLVMTGTGIKTKKNADDMVVIRMDSAGNKVGGISYFGGEGIDGADNLVLDTEGALYLVGNSTSLQKGGARTADFCLLKVKGKEKAWNQPVTYGKEGLDKGLGITITQSGTVIAVGEQAGDALIIGFNDIAAPKINGSTSLRIDRTTLIDDDNNNGTLEEKERGAITFTVQNDGQNDVFDLTAEMETTSKGIVFPQKITIGTLRADESRRVGIPLSISPTMRAENGQMTIRLKATNVPNSLTTEVLIPTRISDKVDLAVANFQFSSNPIRRNQKLNLQVTVRNQGQKTAQAVRLTCILPNEILCLLQGQATNIPRFELGDMPTNTSKTVSIDLKIPSFYREDNLTIKVSLREIGGSTIQQKELTTQLLPFEKDEAVGQNAPSKDSVVVQWLSPFVEDVQNKRLDYTRGSFPLKVKAFSNQPLTAENFKLFVKDTPYDKNGSKSDNVKLKSSGGSYRYAFTYVENVELTEGENKLFFEVQNASGKGKSEEITVNKRAVKPTLHVLAIGVPHADLQFTTNDAADFAKICYEQRGKFFDKVTIVVKNTAATTTIDSLRHAIRTLQLDFLESGTVKSEDLVIVFISSHGKSDKKSSFFKIAASNLDETFIGTTCLDFKEDVLDVLKTLTCKKLILLDACQSGAIDTDGRPENGAKSMEADIGSAIQRFLEAESDLVCITSSNRNEKSWEDPKWQNGAFTEALIEGLTNKTVTIAGKNQKADKDNDGFVELQELFDFISLRIPQMVKETLQKPQTPQLKDANNINFPIFYIK